VGVGRRDRNSTEANLTSKLIFSLQRSISYNFMFLEHRPFSMATFKMLRRRADILRAGPDSNSSLGHILQKVQLRCVVQNFYFLSLGPQSRIRFSFLKPVVLVSWFPSLRNTKQTSRSHNSTQPLQLTPLPNAVHNHSV